MARVISTAELRELAEAGETISAMARHFGCARNTIVNQCRCRGIALPPPKTGPKRKLPATEDILARLRAGESATTIADQHDVTRSAVIAALNRAGWHFVAGKLTRLGGHHS
jgi:hypothetical protein